MKNALILCSGGLDSVTTAYYVKKKLDYNSIKLLFFNYGQRNLEAEEKCARACANELKAEFVEIPMPWLAKISTSLLNSDAKAKKLEREDLKDTNEESQKWYVPYRNTIFLTHALAFAESLRIREKEDYDLFVGFKCEGSESYPDATKEFIEGINNLSRIASSKPFKTVAPLIEKDKEDIVLLAKSLNINFQETFSCYVGPTSHCGDCLACKLRQEGFHWANIEDPTVYSQAHHKPS